MNFLMVIMASGIARGRVRTTTTTTTRVDDRVAQDGGHTLSNRLTAGAGENTLRRLALFAYLDHPTKNDVTSGKKAS